MTSVTTITKWRRVSRPRADTFELVDLGEIHSARPQCRALIGSKHALASHPSRAQLLPLTLRRATPHSRELQLVVECEDEALRLHKAPTTYGFCPRGPVAVPGEPPVAA